jgi:hypothetical protein
MSLPQIVLLQFFWFSFSLIGWVFFRLCTVCARSIQLPKNLHFLVRFFIYFAMGFATFLPVVVISYIFELKMSVLIVSYILVLTLSVYIGVKNLLRIKFYKRKDLFRDKLLLLLLLGLVVDYVLCLYSGGPVFYDTPLQLAKIKMFMESGLSFADPFYGYNGVVDPRYSANFINAFIALAGKLLRVNSAVAVWFYSFAFCRLIIWLGIFSFLRVFLPQKVKKEWSSLVLILCLIFQGGLFTYAIIPNRLVFAWTMLFMIGLKIWFEQKSSLIIIIASLLIATTHAINSLIAGLFMLALLIFWICVESFSMKQISVFMTCLTILVVPVVYNLHYPSRINKNQAYYNAGSVSEGSQITADDTGKLHSNPDHVNLVGIILSALVLSVLFFILAITQKRVLRFVLLILGWLLFVLLLYDFRIIGLAGAIIFVFSARNLMTKATIILAMTCYALIAYNPILLRILSGRVPPWFLDRFIDVNQFSLVTPYVGIVAFVWLFAVFLKFPRDRVLTYVGPLVILVGTFLLLPNYFLKTTYTTSRSDLLIKNNRELFHEYEQAQTLQPLLDSEVIFVPSSDLEFILSPATGKNVLWHGMDVNGSPMTDVVKRKLCSNVLNTKLELNDLHAARIQKIAVRRSEANQQFIDMAASKPYIRTVAQSDNYIVFEVIMDSVDYVNSANSECNIPYGS